MTDKHKIDTKDGDINLNIQLENNGGGGILASLRKFLFFYIFLVVAILTFNYLSNKNNVFAPDLVITDYGEQYQNYNQAFFEFNESNNLINNNEVFNFPVPNGKRIYYIDFRGDIMASQVNVLRKEIDAILQVASKNDEVVVNITSPGGAVTGYGLVASQLERLKKNGVKLTAVIDEVAASGGYMAAVIADEIIAAPFAMVGSIGVVAQVPIMEELFDKIGIDYKIYTAGENKRTVTTFNQPSKEEEEKFKDKLTSIHNQFKNHVLSHRPNVDQKIAMNGDFYSGQQAQELGLIDTISTSDEYLRGKYKEGYKILKIDYEGNKNKKNGFIKTAITTVISVLKEEAHKETVSYF